MTGTAQKGVAYSKGDRGKVMIRVLLHSLADKRAAPRNACASRCCFGRAALLLSGDASWPASRRRGVERHQAAPCQAVWCVPGASRARTSFTSARPQRVVLIDNEKNPRGTASSGPPQPLPPTPPLAPKLREMRLRKIVSLAADSGVDKVFIVSCQSQTETLGATDNRSASG